MRTQWERTQTRPVIQDSIILEVSKSVAVKKVKVLLITCVDAKQTPLNNSTETQYVFILYSLESSGDARFY